MIVSDLTFSPRDIKRLARLQVEVLPDSAISKLGQRYVRSFYRYAQRSPLELVLVERNEAGVIVAGCVVSLDVSSLERRLALHTRLLFEAGLRPVWLWSTIRNLGGPGVPHSVELIYLFTDAKARGRGSATRLMVEAEAELRHRKIPEYAVRTFEDPGNPALAYYLGRGLKLSGTLQAHGSSFCVLTKKLVQE